MADNSQTYPLPDYFVKGMKVAEVLASTAVMGLAVASIFQPQLAIPAAAASATTKVLANLPTLVASAERIFGPGTGQEKARYVTESAQVVAGIVGGVSTGGQAETWAKIEAVVSPVMNQMILAINTFKEVLTTPVNPNAAATP